MTAQILSKVYLFTSSIKPAPSAVSPPQFILIRYFQLLRPTILSCYWLSFFLLHSHIPRNLVINQNLTALTPSHWPVSSLFLSEAALLHSVSLSPPLPSFWILGSFPPSLPASISFLLGQPECSFEILIQIMLLDSWEPSSGSCLLRVTNKVLTMVPKTFWGLTPIMFLTTTPTTVTFSYATQVTLYIPLLLDRVRSVSVLQLLSWLLFLPAVLFLQTAAWITSSHPSKFHVNCTFSRWLIMTSLFTIMNPSSIQLHFLSPLWLFSTSPVILYI